MKKIFVALLILMFVSINGYSQTTCQIEDSILWYLNKVDQYSLYSGEYWEGKDDTLIYYNDGLRTYLLNTLEHHPQTLSVAFERASKQMHITTSGDRKFRIYSWNEKSGGTMEGFYSVLQYKAASGTKVQAIYPKPGDIRDMTDNGDAPGFWYAKIYTVKPHRNKTFYIALRRSRLSNYLGTCGVRAFTIEGDKLNDSIKLFNNYAPSNSIDYAYDLFSNYNLKRRKEKWVVHFSRNKHKLYVPIVVDEKVSGKYLVYKFDGKCYVLKRKPDN
jgi:hypothetical protein